jgi:hypothetical protein
MQGGPVEKGQEKADGGNCAAVHFVGILLGKRQRTIMKHTDFQTAISELRKWNDELERLEAYSRKIPPDKRTAIDAKSEELRSKEKFAMRMLNELDEPRQIIARTLDRKINRAIADLREGIENLAESIERLEECK